MKRIVLDANVIVSALIWRGTPFTLLQAAIESGIEIVTTPSLLAELREVPERPHLSSRLGKARTSVQEALALYAELAVSVTPAMIPRTVPDDPDDDHVIAAAVAARAALVVSGDRHLLALGTCHGIRIVNPAEALALIAG
jgi:putative PIN family toxin of toxin-antitoxin system